MNAPASASEASPAPELPAAEPASWRRLGGYVGVLVGSALALNGWIFAGGAAAWARTLANPSWAPPGPVIGTVWVVLFALMGLALYVLDRDGTGRDSTGRARSAARAAILAQYAVCMAWTGLYFGLRNVPNGFRVTVVAWLLGALCLALAWRASRRATYLLLPLQGWLTFALGLSWTVWQLNR